MMVRWWKIARKLGKHLWIISTSFDQMLQGIETKITQSMNADLIHDFIAHKVEQALKQMKPLIALRPYGMPPIFFKSCWDFIGQDVIAASLVGFHARKPQPYFHLIYTKNKKPKKSH